LNKETFRILKEINSLYLENTRLTEIIASESSRTTKIEDLRSEKEQLIVTLDRRVKEESLKLSHTEDEIAQNQQKLNQAMSNKNNVFTEHEISSFEKQIATYKEKLDELENSGLEIMTLCEELSCELDEAKNFLKGSIETLNNIRLEVTENNKPYQEKINVNTKRMQHLFSELPELLKQKFTQLLERNLKYGPVAQIDKNHCSVCKMELAKSEIEAIEKHLQIKFCPSCSRVFIPISSLY